VKPYYQDDFVTLYHGDCREIVPTLGKFDLLLTDPPYGIGESSQKIKARDLCSKINSQSKAMAKQKDYGFFDWDQKPIPQDIIFMCQESAKLNIIWGGNYYQMPPSACWLLWDKENGANDFADAEMAWTNIKGAVRLKRHLWNGMLRKDNEVRFHPTQKPLEIIKWCIVLAGDNVKTILDPFAGSGTTGRAAKDLGKKCVMIEREEKYCEIAANRMLQECLNF
jgi:DNA modification methylase